MSRSAIVRSLAFALALGSAPVAQAVDRAELEAAIVYNILLFVDWPPEAAPATGGALVLCVDPASRLSGPLRSLAGRPVRTHRLELRELPPSEPARGCHALFVDGASRVRRALAPLKAQPLLLLGDEAAAAPGEALAVRLGQAAGRVVFDIDLAAARQAGLQISSRLLRLARKVDE